MSHISEVRQKVSVFRDCAPRDVIEYAASMDDRWFKKDRESLSRAGSSSVGTREKDDLEDDQSASFSNSVQRMPKVQWKD